MRPGPRTIQALVVLAALSLGAALVPLLVWPLLAAAVAVLALMAAERKMLGAVTVTHDEAPVFVLSLDEEEKIGFRLGTDATRPVRLSVRRVWPKLVAEPSSTLSGVCRPGETLPLACALRGVQRGTAAIDGPHLAMSFWGWAERLVSLASATILNEIGASGGTRRSPVRPLSTGQNLHRARTSPAKISGIRRNSA